MMLHAIFVFFFSWMYGVQICVERSNDFVGYQNVFNLEIDWQNIKTGKLNTERNTVSFLEQL